MAGRRLIEQSDDWLSAIDAGIARCEAAVFVVTDAFRRSEMCGYELRRAAAQAKRLLAVLYDDRDGRALPLELQRSAALSLAAGADAAGVARWVAQAACT